MRPIVRPLLLCLSLFSLPALAEQLSGLYQVREPVASRQPAARDQALQRALDVLLVRLTGKPEAVQNPALAAARQDPQQLILKYGYEGQTLVVDFDPASTRGQLRQAGLPLWGADRPSLLVWWLNEDGGTAQLVGDGQDSAQPLRTAAQYRGLPLRLPMADLDEQLVATPENLASGTGLQGVSGRYGANAMLTVRARQEGGKWLAQWRLAADGGQSEGSTEAPDAATLADAVMLAASGRMAERFMGRQEATERLVLQVAGADLARFAELERVLEPFDARLRRVEGDQLVYQLESTVVRVRSQMALIGLREAGAASQATGQAPMVRARETTLSFRW
ncbi:hypothetical protein AvCA_36880 [Azotobacter vinelandii CA]|uniref:DUF2066 domain-containing protein n=2 Tax=Azotobacter vinelandii TaxID=354 RepID=C1DRV9_AZOVD|nr:DUF2066 domain-containing protein [Azotobacter vinelandii]ACO79834.1 conserved hypothetical protein [Azotobacter vinelandii DJ]AGK16201.1 hypothetical protein AvCA_36880 [Azotobacter vinelandii CA]AGK21540.1 hypothetical protein AvCA6_36880 [Azotobacter vinelandii CA6]WKN20619.1 DUF2066 domain-containing protein [Azotobacter vinelandii]SFX43424.1 hypothetical protein SAMN04244547_01549 [Azotobacter vinelandii]